MKKQFNIFGEQIRLSKKESVEYTNLTTLLLNSEHWYLRDEKELEIDSLMLLDKYIRNMLTKRNHNDLPY